MDWKCWNKQKTETERKIKINDEAFNAQFKYRNNYIKTSKYNVVTFLPVNLWEQFQRVANLYFLFLMILQLVPEISSLNPYTTLVPLLSVLSISAVKDCYDDVQRHKSDNQVNRRETKVIRNGKLIEVQWRKIVVGDIIKINSEEFIAADLLILSTSEPSGLCYVETSELDGETNLKSKQCLASTADLEDNIEAFGEFDGELECEAPNNNLSRFQGTLTCDNKKYAVNNDNLLLRGCILRNTKWCCALVVFAGADTKLMKNSGVSTFKRTHVDKYLNRIILMIVLCLFLICIICAVCSGIWENSYGYYFEVFIPWSDEVPKDPASGAAVIGSLVFFSYIILLNTVVPISLYVSVEMVRLFQSFFINWDEQMIYNGTSARARTTTLNEELGQVQYIFSDKTGTLTQNIMAFNRCSINGVSYGDDDMELQGKTADYEAASKKFTTNFNFYDPKLYKVLGRKDPHACDFFTLLALCHTVMADVKDDKLVYMAQSPDEEALVMAARIFGFVFESRTIKTITIEVDGKLLVYDLLCILDFNNVRKRMSVIVRDSRGHVTLYCKGADTLVYERLSPNQDYIKRKTSEHMENYAGEGLRTLCLAKKDLDADYFEDWRIRYEKASTSLEDREEVIDELFEEIESNMTLMGATAIEDKLQEGVPETIYNLALAGIKIWVLTGDKQETAINVAYSCQLFTDEFEDPMVVDGEDYDAVNEQLTDLLNIVGDENSQENIISSNVENSQENITSVRLRNKRKKEYGLVVNGHSLVYALEEDIEQLLLAVASRCKAVVFCRVTPLQKANVVDLVKRYKKVVTLSIGDGANDVSMIKTAHIGIGISGQEGLQAVLSSDYSIAQFRFLQRLLLVHGRLSYYRMCKFLRYFFYKNFAYTFCELWYAFFVGFSAQTIFGNFFVTCYNMFFTSMPVMSVGVFDQDVNDKTSMKYPKLYAPGPLNMWFGKKQFLLAGTHGLLTSLGLFFLVFGHYYCNIREDGKSISDYYSFGFVLSSILVIVVSVQISLETQYWTMFTQISIFGSIISVFLFQFVYNAIFHGTYYNTLFMSLEAPAYSFICILAVVLGVLPGLVYKFYNADYAPTLTDKAKFKQRLESKLSKQAPKRIPTSTFSPRKTIRRRGSVRSGYAFSHQEGFAKLITGGKLISTKNMK